MKPSEKDEQGEIMLRPITGWTVRTVMETAVFLEVEYVDRPEELETGGQSIRFVATPKQCLDLAEVLTRAARKILDMPSGKKPS